MRKGSSGLIYVVLVVAGVIAGAAGVYIFAPQSVGHNGEGSVQTVEQKSAPELGKKVLYWRAPMDPNYISDSPGKSPMGMDLVPVYEGEDDAAEPGTVKIDPVTVQNIGVRTARATKRELAREIRTVGRVEYDEKRVSHVNTKIEGWIEKLYVDYTGQQVKANDILLEIYSPKLVSTQEEYLLVKGFAAGEAGGARSVPGADSMLETARRRLELLDVPEHQIREIDETGRIMKTLHIHSPASGIVASKDVFEGMFVKPGMNLYTIADISKVWIHADIYEYEMEWVKLGQSAEITLAAYPGKVFKGRVSFIYPFMEPKTRTLKVRIEVENPDLLLKPDMYADVVLSSKTAGRRLAVPAEAVIFSGRRTLVVVADGNGRFTPREVTLGAEAGGYYEVAKGLEEGDDVVTSAQFLIDSESRLREAVGKMLGGRGEPDKAPLKAGKHRMESPKMDMKMDMGGRDMKGMEGHDMKMDGGEDSHQMDMKMDMGGHDMKGMEGHDMKMDGGQE